MPNLMFIVNDSDFGDPRKVFNMDNPGIARAMGRSEEISKELQAVRLALANSGVGAGMQADQELKQADTMQDPAAISTEAVRGMA